MKIFTLINFKKSSLFLFLAVACIFLSSYSYGQITAPDCSKLYLLYGGTIYAYDPVTSTTTSTGLTCPGEGLAIANNFFNNGPAQTFYTVVGSTYYYFDGTGWVSTGQSTGNGAAVNPGGAGNVIYNVVGATGDIYRWDGTANGTFFVNAGPWGGPYDCVGDANGDLYLLRTTAAAQQLLVYNPSGVLECTYNVLNCPNSFAGGGFGIVNGIIYGGLTPGLYSGPVTGPLTITFTPNNYTPYNNASDYANCPLSVGVSAISGKPDVCLNDTVHLSGMGNGTWHTSNPSVASVDTNGVVTGLSAGTTTIMFVGDGTASGLGGGCVVSSGSDSASLVVTVHPLPHVDLGTYNISTCTGKSITLDAGNPGCTYLWNTNATTRTITVNTSGKYSVLVTNSGGCTGKDSVDVLVTPPITYTLDTSICQNDSFYFANKFYKKAVTLQDNVKHTFKTSGGCDSIVTFLLRIKPLPTVSIQAEDSDNSILCIGEKTDLTGQGAYVYYWSTNTKTRIYPDKAEQTITITPQTTKNVIWLKGIDQNFCADSTYIVINAQSCCQLFIPNAFTPNKDGVNDVFKTVSQLPPNRFELRIFNRFGQEVYHTTNIEEGWDGTYNDKPCEVGVYFYYITEECIDGSDFNRKGEITLIR